MIRVTIDLLPATGVDRHTIATLDICNVGGSHEFGDYHCCLTEESGQRLTGEVLSFPRELGAVALVCSAIAEVSR